MGESLWNTYGTFPKLAEKKTNLPFSMDEEASAVHASFAVAWNPIIKMPLGHTAMLLATDIWGELGSAI